MEPIFAIGRGFNGWHYTGKNFSISGDYNETPEKYLHQAVDGAMVYDASGLERGPDGSYSKFCAWVVCGPMMAPTLEGERIETIFNGIIPYREGAKVGGFDKVSPMLYKRLMTEYLGEFAHLVRWGTVRNGKIMWE